MRLSTALYLLAISIHGYSATLSSKDLSANFVFFERAASQIDPETVYWIRGLGLLPRLSANSYSQAPGLGSTPIRFRFSDIVPVRREGTASSFILNDFSGGAEHWRRNVGVWHSVTYQAVRPGVDLEFRARLESRGLEFTATIAPGNSPEAFYLEADAGVSIRTEGTAASITRAFGTITLDSAVAYQIRGGQRVAVAAQFTQLRSARLGITPGSYDQTQPLFLAGRVALQPAEIIGDRLSATGNGGFYLAGRTDSEVECATTTGGREIRCTDVWVARFLASGEPVFLTRLAGEYQDLPNLLAVAPNGDVLVAGTTDSANFPTTPNALQTTNAGPVGRWTIFGSQELGDAFVSRIDSITGNLLYSTFYGRPAISDFIDFISVQGQQVLIGLRNGNARSLALLDPTLSRIDATIDSIGFPATLAESGELTYWDLHDSALVRLSPRLGSRRFTFGLGYKGQSEAHNLFVLPNGNTLVAWTQTSATTPDGVTYLSEIAAAGDRELWRTEVAQKVGVSTIARDPSGEIRLLLGTSVPTVPATSDAMLRASCSGDQSNSVVAQRYSATGDLLFSTYLPGEIRQLSAPLQFDQQVLAGVDAFTLTLHQILFERPPQPDLACVTGAATRVLATAIAPGQIITLLGAGFGANGAEVYINNMRAPLLYVSDWQINAVVPYEGVTVGTPATIEVRPLAGLPLRLTSNIRAGAVEIFTLDASGSGQAAAFNQDGTLNSEQNPALRGSIVVLYGTGIGRTTPASVTGAIAPLTGAGALARPLETVTSRIGFAFGDVVYAGAAPGLINGAAQFNLRVPASLSPGRWPVEVFLGNASSSPRATIWVR